MTTTLDEPTTPSTPAQRLRTTMAGVRLSVTSLGVRKTLTPQQKAQAADTFGAEGTYMSAAKKLLDTSHRAYKRVTGVKNQAVQFWRGLSLPFPEPGLRLIRQDDIEPFNDRMNQLKDDLDEAVNQLNDHYSELVDAARRRLGSLFNAGDYPESLVGVFDIQWEFPSVEPPDYLRRLNPQLYEQEEVTLIAFQDRFCDFARPSNPTIFGPFDEVRQVQVTARSFRPPFPAGPSVSCRSFRSAARCPSLLSVCESVRRRIGPFRVLLEKGVK